MANLYEELANLVAALNQSQAEYALCGGLAMAVHGKVRATIDIDLLVPRGSMDRVKAACRGRGFTVEARPMLVAGGTVTIERLTKKSGSGEVISVGLVHVTDATREAWETLEQLEWETLALPVVSREGLIALKRLRGSGQDADDIAWLESEK